MLGGIMPKSIVWFERLAYLSLLLSILSQALHWSFVQAAFGDNFYVYPVSATITLVAQATLIFLTARRRTNWARWVWIVLSFVLSGFAAIAAIMGTDAGVDPDLPAALARYGMYAVAALSAVLLLMPDARAWFRTAPPPE
jgi:hypothetical protein